MRKQYEIYQSYLGDIPVFLKPFLELDIITRLKDISLLCGMDYASSYAYDFAFYISRYDHALNVALITWNLTHDKASTLAALFHDVSTPVFSHVIDYMNGDMLNQESTEAKTEEILKSSPKLQSLLEKEQLTISDISDFKKYSIVDLNRPKMCADRLDNIISLGMVWVQKLNSQDAAHIIEDLHVQINEDGEEEIAFKSSDIAEYVTLINNYINKLTHTNEDTFMMLLLADIMRLCINLGIITYDELFHLTEHEVISIIENNLYLSNELEEKWYLFKNIRVFPTIEQPPIKNKIINPLVMNKRINL